MSEKSKALESVKKITNEATLLNHTLALLSWDQETYMPEGAIEERSEQQALLSALVHQKLTSPELGQALADLGASDSTPLGSSTLPWEDQRLIRVVWRAYGNAIKIPESFVRTMASATSQGQAAWVKAREADDFGAFYPHLDKLVELKHQQAAYLNSSAEPYDVLLDEYEPGVKSKDIQVVFDNLAKELVPLAEAITQKKAPNDDFLKLEYPVAGQEAFGKAVLSAMGYDFTKGRLDVTAHPFCTTLGRHDVRTTTHYHETDFTKSLYSVIHEGGHALYEMQFADTVPQIAATGTSLGIHESQSRTWENMVARSLPFWEYWFPRLKNQFPTQLQGRGPEDIWRAVNSVERSLIRIYADEVTYSLHIMLRFNLELGIMNRQIKVKDIPDAWNEESKRLLGIVPPSNKAGCLQDIHWSMGGIGYFPTYALGNLYGAMFMEKALQDLPNWWTSVRTGDLSPLREWLKTNIHQYGALKTPGEILMDVTGKTLDHTAFMKYLRTKYTELYNI